jgi:uncharacterized protein Usg
MAKSTDVEFGVRKVMFDRSRRSSRITKLFLFCDETIASSFCCYLSATQLETKMVSQDFRRQLEGYGLTTANIMYRRPDHHWLLQQYVWQDFDLFPNFPELNKFLNYWVENLDGPLHSVTVAHARLIKPGELKAIHGEFRLH